VQKETKTKRHIAIVECIPVKNIFEKTHYSLLFLISIIPGQYLVIDLKGKAVMIGTVYFYLIFHNIMEYIILMINILLSS